MTIPRTEFQPPADPEASLVRVINLGAMAYEAAYRVQCEHRDAVLAAREVGSPEVGRLLLVEHSPPVITVSRRPTALEHLRASPEALLQLGVEVRETDRGGDITYHGPGQLVAYPILDLNRLNLGLVEYLRLLESVVIEACRGFGVEAHRDACATGVWVGGDMAASGGACGAGGAKICAMGVRVRRWVTMHGLALNVTTNLEHFGLIVPCGLAGRPVTSLERELGARCPSMAAVKSELASGLERAVRERVGAAPARP